MDYPHRWEPIADLPMTWGPLAAPELTSLATIWREQAERLEGSAALTDFNRRLQREWAIETGILENLYSLDRGTTQVLIEQGIQASLIPHGATDSPVEHVVALLKDQESTLEAVFDFVAAKRQLSTSYVKQLHQALTRSQERVEGINGLGRKSSVPLLHGTWKKLPNNPTRPDGELHHYCPPEHVDAEMDRLVALHERHAELLVAPEVEAAWLHHRFTQIHPFQDGNGRVARALASLVFLRHRWFPLVVHRDDRAVYIRALEEADAGDLAPLVQLFVDVQKRAFKRALSLSEDALSQVQSRRQVVSAAGERLRARAGKEELARGRVFTLAEKLTAHTQEELRRTAKEITGEIRPISSKYKALVESSSDKTNRYFRQQVLEIARQLDYFADIRSHHAWVRLRIDEERRAHLVVSFHGLGRDFLGILAASAFLEFRDQDEARKTSIEGPYLICRDVFQFSYQEPEEELEQRFAKWLDEVILLGLDTWRRQL